MRRNSGAGKPAAPPRQALPNSISFRTEDGIIEFDRQPFAEVVPHLFQVRFRLGSLHGIDHLQSDGVSLQAFHDQLGRLGNRTVSSARLKSGPAADWSLAFGRKKAEFFLSIALASSAPNVRVNIEHWRVTSDGLENLSRWLQAVLAVRRR